MASDLSDRIRAEVERRLAVARAATEGPWTVEDAYARVAGCRCLSCYEDKPYGHMIPELDGPPGADTSPVLYEHDAAHIVLHDPADAIRRYAYSIKVLAVHQWRAPGVNCGCDVAMCSCGEHVPWPCEELVWLAESLGIDTGGQP